VRKSTERCSSHTEAGGVEPGEAGAGVGVWGVGVDVRGVDVGERGVAGGVGGGGLARDGGDPEAGIGTLGEEELPAPLAPSK
jgi:hypothetical protein